MTQADLNQKENLISQLKNIDNSLIIQRIADFMQGVLAASDSTTDWWDELPESVKEAHKEGLKDIEEGNLIPAEEVIQKLRS